MYKEEMAMTHQQNSLNPAQTLMLNAVNSALESGVMSFECLVKTVGIHTLVRLKPRKMWILLHDKMRELYIAPIVTVRDENLGSREYSEEALCYLTRMIEAAVSSDFGIATYEDVFKYFELINFVIEVPKDCWQALTTVMASYNLADDPYGTPPKEADAAPEVETDDDGEEEDPDEE